MLTEPTRQAQAQRHRTLPAHPSAAKTARQMVTRTLNRWNCPDTLVNDTVLITSELVTNAVRHGSCEHLEILIERRGPLIYLAVSDESPDHPKVRQNHRGSTGRGMVIVDALSKEWGVNEFDGQSYKWVWALLGP